MLKPDEKGRYDLDKLEPGQGIARFWDGHEEPILNWYHCGDEFRFFLPTGHYIYNSADRAFYRVVWSMSDISFFNGPNYEERFISENHIIQSIWYKETK